MAIKISGVELWDLRAEVGHFHVPVESWALVNVATRKLLLVQQVDALSGIENDMQDRSSRMGDIKGCVRKIETSTAAPGTAVIAFSRMN
jgi:hypothetical protein